jgi:hypothetical protein
VERTALHLLPRNTAFGGSRTVIAKKICELRNPEAVVAG